MTDEEMAVEYADKNVLIGSFVYRSCYDVYYDVKQAFLAGLKAGRPKWHKVSDGDYPPCERGNYSINVLTDRGDIAYYNYDDESWIAEPSSAEIDPPKAWCKIPRFEEKQTNLLQIQ